MSSAMSAAPEGGVIGALLASLTPILRSLLSTGLTLGACMGALCWEFCLRLPDETRYLFWPDTKRLFRKRQLPSIPSVLLFWSRIIGAVSVCATIASPSAQGHKTCSTLLYLHGSVGVAGTLTSTMIFVVRTMAVSPGKRWLHLFLFLNALGLSAFCALVTTHLRPTPPFPGVATCSGVVNSFRHAWVLYVWLLAFDLFVAGITLHCIGNLEWRHPTRLPANIKARLATMSGVNRKFFFGAFLAALVSAALNVSQAVYVNMQIAAGNYTLTTALLPLHAIGTCVIAPRMISSLKLHQAKKGYATLESAARGSRHSSGRSHDAGVAGAPDFQLGNGRFLTKAFDNLESGQGSPDSITKSLGSGDVQMATALHAAPVLTRLAPPRHDELESISVVGSPTEIQETRSSFSTARDGNALGLARPPAAAPQTTDVRQTLTRGLTGRSVSSDKS